ncbi:MAG: DUF3368 domain-containing protein [Armatimonadetes bacterium]|nr:DUF3368 domain-containing protein [Armatimonadota bacterium]
MTRCVADAAPLIFLAKLGYLELLRLNADEILVPTEVLREVMAKDDEAAKEMKKHLGSWLKECEVVRYELLRLLPDMDEGERAVLAQAIQEGFEKVVLDDMEARRVARRIGLKPIGTVGLLIAAHKKGLIPSLKVELERLKALGFWISETLQREALEAVGENF